MRPSPARTACQPLPYLVLTQVGLGAGPRYVQYIPTAQGEWQGQQKGRVATFACPCVLDDQKMSKDNQN